MTTVAYAELHLETGGLRYACAGHPPPIVLEPGRIPSYLWEARSPPVDAAIAGGPRPEAAHRIGPGGTLLLYTDGLIERRSRSLRLGLAALLEEVARQREREVGPMVSAVVRALADREQPDDVCLLGARRVATP